MTASIETFLTAATQILGPTPGVKSCEVGRGRFKKDELAATSFRTPALRVAAGAVKRLVNAGDGRRDVTLRIGVAIVTTDGKDGPRETQAVRLLDHLLLLLPTNPWGLDWAEAPAAIDAVNAYTGDVGRLGLMIWEIGFDQTIRLGTPHPATSPVIAGGAIPAEVEITNGWRGSEVQTWKAGGDA